MKFIVRIIGLLLRLVFHAAIGLVFVLPAFLGVFLCRMWTEFGEWIYEELCALFRLEPVKPIKDQRKS